MLFEPSTSTACPLLSALRAFVSSSSSVISMSIPHTPTISPFLLSGEATVVTRLTRHTAIVEDFALSAVKLDMHEDELREYILDVVNKGSDAILDGYLIARRTKNQANNGQHTYQHTD